MPLGIFDPALSDLAEKYGGMVKSDFKIDQGETAIFISHDFGAELSAFLSALMDGMVRNLLERN
jgi:hypothetical protein